MPEGYCWVCDRPVDDDPCPTCGTRQYEGRTLTDAERRGDEVLDTTPGVGPVARARNPLILGLIVVVALVVLVLVFQAGAGIS